MEFGTKDITELPTDLLEKTLLNLNITEINKICRTNERVKSTCDDESFWKRKVMADFGIERKIKATWRLTAKTFVQMKVMNLNDTFVNGQTYKEIFDDTLDAKDEVEYGDKLIHDVLIKLLGENVILVMLGFEGNSSIMIELINFDYDDHYRNQLMLFAKQKGVYEELKNIMDGPIAIIWLAMMTRKYKHMPANGTDAFSGSDFSGATLFIIADIIDPILLILEYHHITRDDITMFNHSLIEMGKI